MNQDIEFDVWICVRLHTTFTD